MSIKNLLQTPENFQLYSLLNTIRNHVKTKDYDSRHKFAFIEEMEKEYYEKLHKLEGTPDAEGSIIEKFDISIQNYYQIIKKLQEILDNFLIDNNQLLFHYLDSEWDEDDKKHIFTYQQIINTIIEELEKNEQIKPSGPVKDLNLGDKSLERLSQYLNIPVNELEEKSQKELAETLRNSLIGRDERLKEFDKELDAKDKDELLNKIHELEDKMREKGIPVPGDEENRKFNLPDIVINHINSITNITEEEKIASLEILEENDVKFDKEFLEEFEDADFKERCIMLENILVKCLEKRKDSLFEDFMRFDGKFIEKHNLTIIDQIPKEKKKEIWDSMMNAFQNMSDEDRQKLIKGDTSMLEKLADSSYQDYKNKQNNNQE